jgi:hypothetical protein
VYRGCEFACEEGGIGGCGRWCKGVVDAKGSKSSSPSSSA